MGAGGAERVMSYLIRHLAERHEVSLLTFEPNTASSFYAMPQGVRIVRTDRLGGSGLTWLSKVLSRPTVIADEMARFGAEVALSFMDTMNVMAIVAGRKAGVPIVVSERSDPGLGIDPARRFVRDRAYRQADYLVCQTKRIARYFPVSLQPRIRVIANPVWPAPLAAKPAAAQSDGRYRIISVGRLAAQKGHDRLIAAFARIATERPNWDLHIIGEGPLRPKLEAEVRRLGLADRVSLPGLSQTIGREFAEANLMVMPSLHEGFPNALAEALAAGLPAVGYRNVSGVEDMIVGGQTGLLADPQAPIASLAEALSILTGDANLRAAMGEAACHHVVQWSPDRILMEWESLLIEAAARRR